MAGNVWREWQRGRGSIREDPRVGDYLLSRVERGEVVGGVSEREFAECPGRDLPSNITKGD